MKERTNGETNRKDKILSIVGIVICILLVPILIVNCTLLVKGLLNPNEVPSLGGVFPMIVYTDSMKGVFDSGSLIICQEIAPEDVKDEDIITFFDPAGNGTSVVTHRVEEITTDKNGKRLFWTKGDANNIADMDPVPEDKLIGIYTGFHIPFAGSVALFMQSTPGLIICIGVPVLLLVGYDFLRRRKYEKSKADDKDELLRELEELRKLKSQSELGVRSEELGVATDTVAPLAVDLSATPAHKPPEEEEEEDEENSSEEGESTQEPQ